MAGIGYQDQLSLTAYLAYYYPQPFVQFIIENIVTVYSRYLRASRPPGNPGLVVLFAVTAVIVEILGIGTMPRVVDINQILTCDPVGKFGKGPSDACMGCFLVAEHDQIVCKAVASVTENRLHDLQIVLGAGKIGQAARPVITDPD